MKYYTLSESTDTNIIGYYPQTDVSEDSEFFSVFIDFQTRIEEFPEHIPKYIIILNKKAYPTDFIERVSVPYGLVVNSKIKSLITLYSLPNHKFYDTEVIYKKSKLNYYWFHFYDDIFQYIDMKKSKFILKWRDVSQEFCFTSKDFFKSKKRKTFEDFETKLIIKEVYLLNSFPKYDIFHFEGRNIISEKLLNAFIENNITGYEVSEYDILKTE
ncbi:hypothetical protein [Capnocytophaga endodontalis]|uniref:hypothetical protein n=1 Tax=Capnocytophaga endodontalis TaxID=2708117 RepID=UPI001428B8AB|nr:hypothetical protein [Capnocytophaga endodontalis]